MTDRGTIDALERLVVAAVALTTRSLSAAQPDLDLTLAQWRVLLVLGDEMNGATISQVAGRIGVTLPATSRQLRRLERRGLVQIGPDEADRRATRVRLSSTGKAVRRDVIAFRRRELAKVSAVLGEAPGVAAELGRIADGMDRSVQASRGPSRRSRGLPPGPP